MTQSVFAKLPKKAQKELLVDLNYLHLAEIKSFCKRHSIPYRIAIETPGGDRKVTRDDDRKGVILERIRHFLKTGEILRETCFQSRVVCFDRLPKSLAPDDRLYYGQYDKKSRAMIDLLKALTDERFENGAIARMLARSFWAQGQAPTYAEFASAWLQALRDHTQPNPEWAFLSDRANSRDTANWKRLRNDKASQVMEVLNQITPK